MWYTPFRRNSNAELITTTRRFRCGRCGILLHGIYIIFCPKGLMETEPRYGGIRYHEYLWCDLCTECDISSRRCHASRVSYLNLYSKVGHTSYHNSPAGQVGVADVVCNKPNTSFSDLRAVFACREGPTLCLDTRYCGKDGRFRPSPVVFKLGVPTLMDVEGCMVRMNHSALHPVHVFINDVFLSMASLEMKE